MSNLPFGDDPFNDDPFRDIPDDSGSSGPFSPRGDSDAGQASGRTVGDLRAFSNAPIEDTTEDLPADLLISAPPRRGRNGIFIAGLGLLALVVIIGLGVILYNALGAGETNRHYEETRVAVVATNNAVFTSVAASSTAKSWTATPSKTPTLTPSLTPSLTFTLTPTLSLTPTLTVTPSITNTLAPHVTPPTVTPPPTLTLPPPVAPDNSALSAQIQRMMSALQILGIQQTAIAAQPRNPARQTESAQIGAAQTAIVSQLTANPGVPGAGAGNGPGSVGGQPTTISSPTATSTATPTPTIAPTLPELFPPTAVPTSGNAGYVVPQAVMAIHQPMQQVQIVGTPVSPQPAKATTSGTLLAITATLQALSTNEAQLGQVQTAISIQLTMNGMTPTSEAGNAADNQLELGLTAVAYQLTQDDQAFKRLENLNVTNPRTGLYEDLANGRATPAGLALIGLAAIGLIGVIVASRRMRVR